MNHDRATGNGGADGPRVEDVAGDDLGVRELADRMIGRRIEGKYADARPQVAEQFDEVVAEESCPPGDADGPAGPVGGVRSHRRPSRDGPFRPSRSGTRPP